MRLVTTIGTSLLVASVAACSASSGGCPDASVPDGFSQGLTCQSGGPVGPGLLGPGHLTYRGAFRLPDLGQNAPRNYAWGGKALAYFPDGDPAGTDAFPGSLFVAGNDAEEPWSQTRASFVGEVSIPAPVISKTMTDLPVATALGDLFDLRANGPYRSDIFFELPKLGLLYLPPQGAQAAGTLYQTWGQHIEDENAPSSCGASPDPSCVPPIAARTLGAGGALAAGTTQGPWWVANASLYSINDYLFEIPQPFADAHLAGRRIAAGRFRDGGQGGLGPVIYAIGPWLEGNPPAPGATLGSTALLRYGDVGDDSRRLTGYHHADEWAGGAWLTAGSRSAVIFAGAKAVGPQCWYGWQRCPCGVIPCVEPEDIGGPGCFEADGSRCRLQAANYCSCSAQSCSSDCFGERGWWTQHWEAQIIFYDPAELARVAAGELEPHQPQPYACLSIADRLLLSLPPGVETSYGSGPQRRYQLGGVAYDRQRNLLYVTEQLADPDTEMPVVHVFQVQE